MSLLGDDIDPDLTEIIYQAVHAAGAGAYYAPYIQGDILVIPLYGGATLRVPLPGRAIPGTPLRGVSPPPENTLPVAPETKTETGKTKTRRRKSA